MELSLSSSDLSWSEESARERVMFIKSSSVIHPLLLDSSQHGFAMLTEARLIWWVCWNWWCNSGTIMVSLLTVLGKNFAKIQILEAYLETRTLKFAGGLSVAYEWKALRSMRGNFRGVRKWTLRGELVFPSSQGRAAEEQKLPPFLDCQSWFNLFDFAQASSRLDLVLPQRASLESAS